MKQHLYSADVNFVFKFNISELLPMNVTLSPAGGNKKLNKYQSYLSVSEQRAAYSNDTQLLFLPPN